MPVGFSEKNLGQLGKTGSGEGTPGSTYPLNMVGNRDCDQYQLEDHARVTWGGRGRPVPSNGEKP